MTHQKIRYFVCSLLLVSSLLLPSSGKTPQLTVVVVIDQFAYSYLYKLKPYLTGGIKTLLDNGISYENAHHAHAMPETAVGHAALSTGAFAHDHGIIANSWFDTNGNEVESDDDDAQTAAVLKDGDQVHSYGKGPKLLMTEGLSDQFVLQSKPESPYLAFAFSLKSRAAIMCASKLGKAVWFDKETGLFTSSKAYYNQLPAWLTTFNKQKKISALKSISWKLALNKQTGAYNFPNIENYSFTSEKESLIEKNTPLKHELNDKNTYAPLCLNPMSNQLLLDLAKSCIKEHLTKKNHLLVWISLSSLDLIGHRYGPDSLEAIDTIYHIDKQLKPFIKYVMQATGNNTMFVLTADHGVLPMQEILRLDGINTAHKLSPEDLINAMNKLIEDNHAIEHFVSNFQMPQFYFNQTALKDIDQKTLNAITKELKNFLHHTAGVKNVWTKNDLDTFSFDPVRQELELYFKNQRYPERSGDLFVQLQPYTLLSKYKAGTTHESPYNYDTHVPLVLYQPGKYEHISIIQKVYATQLANTLAQILDIRKPPASTAQVLPGIFGECSQEIKRSKKNAVIIMPSVIKKQQQAHLV